MGKSKSKPSVPAPVKKSGDGGRVTKPATKVEKGKAAAKAVVAATQAAGSKVKSILSESVVESIRGIINLQKQNTKKEESEEEESSEESSEEEESSSDEDSSEEEDSSEAQEVIKEAKVHPAALKKGETSSSEEESDSDVTPFYFNYLLKEEDSSSEEVVQPKKNGVKAKPASESSSEEEDDDDDDDDEEDDDEDSDEEEEAAAKPAPKKTNGAKAKPESDSDDEEDSDEEEDSDSDEEDEEESEEEEEETKPAVTAGQKRKAPPTSATETPTKRSKPESGSASVFVGNLSWNIDQEWLASIFESIGGVVSARIITERDSGRPKGFGYVDFESAEFAKKALELKGTDVDGRPINVDLAQSKSNDTPGSGDRAKRFGDKISEPSATLFVGNLSFSSSQESLYDLFGQVGTVNSVRIPTDRETGQVKGYTLIISF
jgi:nucleolin